MQSKLPCYWRAILSTSSRCVCLAVRELGLGGLAGEGDGPREGAQVWGPGGVGLEEGSNTSHSHIGRVGLRVSVW